eukprot:TRINITY_DN6487_c0_g1_i4.p1 TRINITY_DN6487_c0_g1~~TRINITY_DN6487_c0_g1_i4.p1  ORF type:complete len:407 (+),score=56.16 TRINITY_DN6487_c0_g1_i4:114-1223(+)
MNYCSVGSLKSVIEKVQKNGKTLSEQVISIVIRSVLKGLAYLHSVKICHRDIKSANILIDADGMVKVSDFGISTYFKSQQNKEIVGSPWWMAPEVIMRKINKRDLPKVDIWSLGITAIEMAYGKPPYSDLSPEEVMKKIASSDTSPSLKDGNESGCEADDKWSEEFEDFVKKCLERDPKKRWSARHLLRHEFVRRVKGRNIRRYLRDWMPEQGTVSESESEDIDPLMGIEEDDDDLYDYNYDYYGDHVNRKKLREYQEERRHTLAQPRPMSAQVNGRRPSRSGRNNGKHVDQDIGESKLRRRASSNIRRSDKDGYSETCLLQHMLDDELENKIGNDRKKKHKRRSEKRSSRLDDSRNKTIGLDVKHCNY